MPLTREQLEFVVKVQHDTIGILMDQLAEAQRKVAEVARDEWENGRLDAHREHAEWGSHLRELIRAGADHLTPYAQRRAAELEWAKPRAGDYTGRLSPAEYFGTEPPQLRSLERRAA